MSTDFITAEKILFSDVFDGRLEKYGIREYVDDGQTSDRQRCLTDGRNYIWFFCNDSGKLDCMRRYGANAPQRILNAIEKAFDTAIYCEHEPQFWGFESQEEWDSAMEEASRKDEENLYAEIMKFVGGQRCDLRPGTIGMIMANIAKELIAKNRGLALPSRWQELMEAVHQAYETAHSVKIILSDQDIKLAELIATHEEDLPQS